MQRKHKCVFFIVASTLLTLCLTILSRSTNSWAFHGYRHSPYDRQQQQQQEEAESGADEEPRDARDPASAQNSKTKSSIRAVPIATTTSTSTSASTTASTQPQSTECARRRPPRIPLIFHQIYKDTALPAPYGICLYSLLRNHRFRDGRQSRNASAYRGEFDYYFWTDQSIKEYKEDHKASSSSPLKKQFEYFSSARETVEVADMVRYFFLYEFGGIYLDLDMEPVNSFLPLIERDYPCVLSEENPIQVNSVWGGSFGVTNAIMMCRPQHPFMKLLIESLPEFKDRYHVVLRTGPRFVTAVLERYQAANKTRAEECAKDATSRDDCVYTAPAHIFETLHNIHAHRYKDHCRGKVKDAKPEAFARDSVLRYCRDYLAGIEQRGTSTEFAHNSERLAVHHYLHMGYRTGSDRNCAANTFDMKNLIRGYWMYKPKEGFTYNPSGFD